MTDCVESMVKDFTGKLREKVTTPAAEHSLKVNPDCEKLDEQRAKEFHNMVAQGLHVSQGSGANIQPVIAFMCTRASDPDEDD